MRLNVLATGFLLCLVTLGSPAFTFACSCMDPGPPCQAYWKTDAVLDATVLAITKIDPSSAGYPGYHDLIVKVEIRRTWKGTASGVVEIVTASQGSACGVAFKEGERYLIFASHSPLHARLQTSICTLTQPFSGGGEAAEFLASLAGPAQGGRVFGEVTTSTRVFDHERSNVAAKTETRVHLIGGRERRTVVSRGGRYEFAGLEHGAYRVEVEVPEGHSTHATWREVEVASRYACVRENYRLTPAGRIAGLLVGPDGRGLPGVNVEITSPEARPHPDYGLARESVTTDGFGHFELTRLPPGRYVLGVNLTDLPNQRNPYSRTVYPGQGEQQILELSLGASIDVGTWYMPPPLPIVRVEGLITWSDGSPAAGVYVSAWDRTGNPVEKARGAGGATADGHGRFVIALRQGRIYDFGARDRQSMLLPVSGPRIEAGINVTNPVRLVIRTIPH